MAAAPFRYEPLPTSRFPLGEGPFRARGIAFSMAFKYIDARLPGGRAAFLAALGAADPFLPFYDQIFLASADYDLSPLARLYAVCAQIEGVSVGRFIEDRSRWSGEADPKGVWKPMLKASSPEDMADRTRFAFDRYFPPCRAERTLLQVGRFEGLLSKVPVCMSGIHASATVGFVCGALESMGAVDARMECARLGPDGSLSGVLQERLRFVTTWTSPG
jgi:hypothetical protein